MFSRRGILGLFSGLISWFTAKKVVAEPVITALTPHPVKGYIQLPDWCPDGWVPLMGQNICKEQFPALFEPAQFKRKNGKTGKYLPPFVNNERANLPMRLPTVPTELQAHGFIDHQTRIVRKEADTRISVHLIAVKPQVWANGKISQAGLYSSILIDRKQFEDFYGPIEKSGVGLFYNGYEALDHYV